MPSQVRGVYVARLDGSESRRLLDADAQAVHAASGHLLFVRQGDLLAQPFDAPRLALNGVAFRLSGQVSVNPRVSLASLSTSAAGAIAYGTGSIRRTQFTWFDRSGKRLETLGAPDKTPSADPALSHPTATRFFSDRPEADRRGVSTPDLSATARSIRYCCTTRRRCRSLCTYRTCPRTATFSSTPSRRAPRSISGTCPWSATAPLTR